MLRFQVLGPVEVLLDGRAVPLRGPKQHALLGLLLLNNGAVVSRDRLVAGLWGDAAPPGVEHALDAQVSTLRQSLAAIGGPPIERRPPGYLLAVDPDALDATRFEYLVTTGRTLAGAGDAEAGARTLREALDLWRGTALADVQSAPYAADASAALEVLRVDALEDRVEADLARGKGAGLVAELEALLRDHPFRERLIAALATSLYRAGQQARALEVIARARREFAAELGVVPGAAVLDLEPRILTHDPELRCGVDVPSSPRLTLRRPGLGRRRIRWLAVGAAAVLLGGILQAVETSGGAGKIGSESAGAQTVPVVETAGVTGFEAATGRAQKARVLAGAPSALQAGPGGVWVAEASDNAVELVDPVDGDTLAKIQVPGAPGALAVGDGAVWVACTLTGQVVRIDQGTQQVTQTIRVGGAPTALAFGGKRLWVADQNGSRLLAVNAGTGEVAARLALSNRPSALAADASRVWVASHDSDTVTLVDTASASPVASVHVGGGPVALAEGAGAVWVANNEDSTVSRLDPSTGRVTATVPVNSGPVALAYTDGALWVAGEHAHTVARLDPAQNRVTRETSVGGSPEALAAFGDSVWAGALPVADARGGTLTMLAQSAPSTVDPGFQAEFSPPQMLGLVHDGLVTLEQSSGPRGLQLVPDLAVSLPAPAASATSYTFQLRPGIRYSTGVPVRAADFRRALERLFRGSSTGTSYYTGLVGADRCQTRPESCRLRQGVVTNNAAGTVTFHLTSPDPDFLFRLAAIDYSAPVPPGTAPHDNGMTPIAGTGPYVISHASADEIRLERNPRFTEWSYAAQPDGNADTIVWRFGLDHSAQVRAVRAGEADWMSGIPARLWASVRNHDTAQLRLNDIPETDFMVLRTQVRPFDDIRVRRALNFAVDRRLATDGYGGLEAATPTCQMLPPSEPASVPYCPYTRGPSRNGVWQGPDLRRARRLVAESGTRGLTVSVLGISDDIEPPGSVARVTAQALRRIGYRVELTIMTRARYNRMPPTAQNAFDVGPFAWYADFPSPSTFFQTMLVCHAPAMHGRICEPGLDRSIARALAHEAEGRGDAERLWAAIDRRATRLALTVPLVNPRSIELTSPRLSGYEYNPQLGFLPALASVA